MAQVVADTKTNIISAKARADRNRRAKIHMVLEIRDLDELGHITGRIGRVPDVLSVERVVREG